MEVRETVVHEGQVPVDVVDPSISALQTGPGRAEKIDEALTHLADQIPRPHAVSSGSTGCSLQQLALLTREFNGAMGLPEGASVRVVTYERGQQYGRMLLDEIREIEEAIKSGIAHDVLAELTDVIYLTLNLGQECGLQDWLEDAFLVKHSDNMRKQHDSVTHLSWTRTAHARACNCTEESLNFTVFVRLLYSNGKLIKPYDYVPSDYSQLLNQSRNQLKIPMRTDSDTGLKQLRNDSIVVRTRPFGKCYSYLRDVCYGTLLHPPCVDPVFEPGKTQKADGLTKILGRSLQLALMSHLGMKVPSYL